MNSKAMIFECLDCKEIVPDNIYLKESYRRLTEEKKEYKQRYCNYR